MALAEGPDLDDEVSRSSSHLVKDDGAGATDPKTYQARSIANTCLGHTVLMHALNLAQWLHAEVDVGPHDSTDQVTQLSRTAIPLMVSPSLH